MLKRGSGQRLNCFSPPVMIATLIIESVLVLYTLWRYKLTRLTRLVVVIVVGLAFFQLSEYHVCTGFGARAVIWSRLGFVAITLMPALGLHILHLLAGKPGRRLVAASYATMGVFIIYFLSYHAAFIGHQCTGNYVIFQIGDRLALAYGIYYYGWLFTAIGLGFKWAQEFFKAGKPGLKRMQMARGLIVGYLIFLVPTAVANTVKPSTRRGIPSIMCGFAVLFALILTFYILPRAAKLRGHLQHKAQR
ncbi:MAG: hypothetical protein ACREGA_04045 [Candidatus Saccharimonadales bacterium]